MPRRVQIAVVLSALAAVLPSARAEDLEECLRLGLDRSQRLQAARAQIDAIRNEGDALLPTYLPQAGLEARALWVKVHSTMPAFDMSGAAGALPPDLLNAFSGFDSLTAVPDRNLDLTLRLYQPLTQLLQISYARDVLIDGERLATLGHDVARDTIALGIGASYFNVLLMDRQLEALARARTQIDRAIEDGTRLLNQGVMIRADLLKIEIRRREIDVQILQATSGRDMAKSSLGKLIGLPSDRVTVSPVDVRPTTLADLAWHLEEGRANRRELRMGALQERMAANQARATWMALLPQVGVVAQTNFNDDNVVTSPDRTYMAGGMLSWNFFGMGSDVLKARAADSNRAKVAAEAAAARDDVELSIERAWRDAVVARDVVDAAKQTIEQAAESFRAESERYKEGKSTTSDLLGAQTQLTTAETSFQAALYGVALADAALNVAIGRAPFPELMD